VTKIYKYIGKLNKFRSYEMAQKRIRRLKPLNLHEKKNIKKDEKNT